MSIAQLIEKLETSSGERLVAHKAWEKSESRYEEAFGDLVSHVRTDFEHYLVDHKEIPGEEYRIEVHNGDHNNLTGGPLSESERRNFPYNADNLSINLVIGKPEEPDMHDVILYTIPTPVDVTELFQEFTDRNMPLKIRLYRFRNSFERVPDFYRQMFSE